MSAPRTFNTTAAYLTGTTPVVLYNKEADTRDDTFTVPSNALSLMDRAGDLFTIPAPTVSTKNTALSNKWVTTSSWTNYVSVKIDNGLVLEFNPVTTGSIYGGCQNNADFDLTDPWDVYVDWEQSQFEQEKWLKLLVANAGGPTAGYIDVRQLIVSGNQWVQIRITLRDGTSTKSSFIYVAGVPLSGRLQMSYDGTNLYAYYDVGSGWVLGLTTVPIGFYSTRRGYAQLSAESKTTLNSSYTKFTNFYLFATAQKLTGGSYRYPPSGTWVTPIITAPSGEQLDYIDLTFLESLSADKYVENIKILDSSDNVLSSLKNPIISGSHLNIEGDLFDNGFSGTLGVDYKVALTLAGNELESPLMSKLVVNHGSVITPTAYPFWYAGGGGP